MAVSRNPATHNSTLNQVLVRLVRAGAEVSACCPPRGSYCQRLREQRLWQCLVPGFEPVT